LAHNCLSYSVKGTPIVQRNTNGYKRASTRNHNLAKNANNYLRASEIAEKYVDIYEAKPYIIEKCIKNYQAQSSRDHTYRIENKIFRAVELIKMRKNTAAIHSIPKKIKNLSDSKMIKN